MIKYLFFFTAFVFIVSCTTPPGDLVIVDNGKSNYRIIYGDKAPDSTIQAIQLFKDNLKLVTGIDFMVFSDIVGEQPEEILIGASNRTSKYMSSIPLQDLESGFYSGPKGKKWLILGNSSTAIQQALYDVVVRLGCVKLNESMTQYNKQSRLVIPATPLVFKPSFTYRQAINPNALNRDFQAWNFLTVDNQKDWGTWEYSMERIFPSESYFNTHPEYFAQVNGKRVPNQVNFNHPNLKGDLEKNLEVWTMAKGRAHYWAISPYQNSIISEDEYTVKAIQETGSASGALLQLVNEVALKNKNRTYAVWLDGPYRRAPTAIKPEENVMIVMDTKDIDQSVSMGEGPINENFRNDLKAWKSLTSNIAVVSHVTNEDKFMMPFPNLYALQKSLQYLNAEGLKKIIFTGFSGPGASMPELKFYVASNLAWDANQNIDTLIWRFCDNQFGKAGNAMFGYVQALEKTIQAYKSNLSAYGSPADGFRSWLQPNNINQLYSYFNATTSITSNNSELREMVERYRMGLIYAQLEVAKSMGTKTFGYFMNIGAISQMIKQEKSVIKEGAIIEERKAQWGSIKGMKDLLDQFVNDCVRLGILAVDRSGLTPSQFRDQTLAYIDQKVQVHSAFKNGTFNFNISPDPYYGGGDESLLIDGLTGIVDNPKSTWIGLSGGEAEVTWSIGKDTVLKSITTRFLQQPQSRAWLPNSVTCLISKDGSSFQEVKTMTLNPTSAVSTVQSVSFNLGNQPIRSIKLKASGRKSCPKDQVNAGQPAAILMDELVIH